MVPGGPDVGDPAGNVDEVDRPLPDDLVGDVDIAALGISGLGSQEFDSRRMPPQDSGSTCASVSENVHRWPAGSSAAYWRSPYSKSVGSIRIRAPCSRARSQCACASSIRTMTRCVTSPVRGGF